LWRSRLDASNHPGENHARNRKATRTVAGFARDLGRRVAIVFLVAAIIALPVCAGPPDATARQLLASWKDEDPGMRAVAEVIAAAFASGLAWSGTLGGNGVYCPPPALAGPQIMSALQQFVGDNPDAADEPYGGVLAKSLHRAFPCATKRNGLRPRDNVSRLGIGPSGGLASFSS